MALVRAQISVLPRQADPPRDVAVNVVYHEVASGIIWGDVDYQNHANEIRDLFAGLNPGSGSTFLVYANRQITVKVYDMAQSKPRVPKAISIHTPATWETQALGPRQLALCCSFYGNNPGDKHGRGRIYVGPFNAVDISHERVPTATQQYITDLGHGLFDIGGQNVKHVVHSPTKLTDTTVQNYWCNDLWDVIRQRQPKEMTRTKITP